MASKIGRNDPCPCGSGKKYKKCCLDKEGVAIPRLSVADDHLVLPPRYVDDDPYYEDDEALYGDKPDDEDEISLAERERWKGLMNQIADAAPEMKAQLAMDFAERETDLNSELVLILIESILDPLLVCGRYDDLSAFIKKMAELYPRQAKSASAWINKYLAVIAFYQPGGDLITPLLDLARGDDESVVELNELISPLVFHNRRKELNAVLPVFWERVRDTRHLIAEREDAEIWYLALALNELVDPVGLASDQKKTITLVDRLWQSSDEELKYSKSRYLGKAEPQWVPDQFSKETDRLAMLMFDFGLFLYRERGWSFLRADLARRCLSAYFDLRSIEARQSRKKAKRIIHPLLPDVVSADLFISSDLQVIFPQPYQATTFFLALKPWLEFLTSLGLVEPGLVNDLGERLKSRLKPIDNVLAQLLYDSAVLSEVKARLEEAW